MGKKFHKTRVLTIALAHNIHDIYTAFFAPLLPLLIAKLHIPLSAAAILQVARNAPTLFNPLLALIAEKKGVKYFIIITPGVTAIAMSLIGLANSFAVLFILLFVSGISAAFFHVPSPVIVRDSSGDNVGTGMSWYMVGGELARTIGPLVATAAVSFWSLEETWKLMPLGIIASLILYFKLKDYHPVHNQSQKPIKGDTTILLKKYRYFFMALGGFIMFNSAMKTALVLYLPVYLIEKGASLWYSGVSLSVLQGFGVLGTFLAGPLSDKIGRKRTLLFSSIGTVLFMGLFSFFNSMILLCFLGFFMFASGPVLLATVQDTDTSMPTFMNGLYMTINFGVGSFIALAIGYLGDTIGLDPVYRLCSLIGLGLIPLAVLLPLTIKEKSSV
jgi:FSR family fosmidomycin resistance protein-like MFS transporter